MATLGELGNYLQDYVYETLMVGDADAAPPPDRMLTWLMPGLPLNANDFRYLTEGILAEDMSRQSYYASSYADFIPNVAEAFNNEKQLALFGGEGQGQLSRLYQAILEQSKVVRQDLSPEQEARIAENREIFEQNFEAYTKFSDLWETAVRTYQGKRIAALVAGQTGQENNDAALDFRFNRDSYLQDVRQALQQWEVLGHRREFENAANEIAQVGLGSMVAWRTRLLEQLTTSVETVPSLPGSPSYFPSLLAPPSFAADDAGWINVTFSEKDTSWQRDQSSRSWKGGGSLFWGLFSIGASGKADSSVVAESKEVSSFAFSMKWTQVTILRPWFDTLWFKNRGWDLGGNWEFEDVPSNGERPPEGNFIAYPVSMIFAKEISIESSDFADAVRTTKSSIGPSGGIGWGPFRIRASGSKNEVHEDHDTQESASGLSSPGMQLIAYVDHLIGKAPNPREDLEEEDFIG